MFKRFAFVALTSFVLATATAYAGNSDTTFAQVGDPTFLVHTDLSQSNPVLQEILSGVRGARELLKENLPVDVYVYQNRDALAAASGYNTARWETAWAITKGPASYFDANRFTGVADWNASRIAASEYVHVHHNILLGRSFGGGEYSVPIDGPYWLAEGVGQLVAFRAIGPRGETEWQKIRAKLPPQSLTQLEAWHDFATVNKVRDAYGISHLAAEFLAQKTSLDKVVTEYWRTRGSGDLREKWEVTFQKVFGMSVEQFYAAFDQSMRGGA